MLNRITWGAMPTWATERHPTFNGKPFIPDTCECLHCRRLRAIPSQTTRDVEAFVNKLRSADFFSSKDLYDAFR